MWTNEAKFEIFRMFSKTRVCARKKPRERLNAEGVFKSYAWWWVY